MIEINLLPPEHRPVERTPLPRLLTIFGGVLLSAAAVIAWLWLSIVSVPNAKRNCDRQKEDMEKVKKVADRVEQIDRELKAAKDRQDVLNELFNQRVAWGKILDRIAEARASVKSTDEVVLSRVEIRKTAGTSVPGKRTENRLLFVQGFVGTSRKEAGAGELRDVGIEFVQKLCRDSVFKQDFECEEAGERNAKYNYLGDQFTDKVRPATSGTGTGTRGAPEPREPADELKATLTFEVTFAFKPPPTVAKPAAAVAKPATPPAKK